MKRDQNQLFLRRELSHLLPDVFFHPVWIHMDKSIANYSPDFVKTLLHELQLEQINDNPVSNCQIIFMCAYLQSKLGDYASALVHIEQAWIIADMHGLQQIARCAAWGACAICVRRGNYQEAVNWLDKLQEKLEAKHEWILIDILDLFKQVLETQAPYPKGDLLVWLLRWGEWPLNEVESQSKGGYRTRMVGFLPPNLILRLSRPWSSFWGYIRHVARNLRFPQQSTHPGESANEDGIRDQKSSQKPKVSQFDEKLSSSTTTFLLHDTQMPSEISDLSASLPQAHITTSPLHITSASQQQGLPSVAVYSLGQFQVYQDEQLVENWLSRKGLSVFKYLIHEHPAQVGKEILMETFWPDSDAESARRNLHQAIYSLRQTFRGEQQGFHHIWFKNDCYSLNPNLETWIDFRAFEKCIDVGRRLDKAGRLDEAIEQYGTAEGLYQGDFLEEDLYEDWPILQREQLLTLYLSLVDRLSELYFQNRQYTTVVHLSQKLLAKDGCYEAAHRRLMQCYHSQGQRHLAVRQYQTCIRTLKEELDIPPSRETVSLYQSIVSNRGV